MRKNSLIFGRTYVSKRANKAQSFVIIVCGNALEYYEFSLYSFLIPKISQYFFSGYSPATSIIMSYGIFAIGFLARPLGGIFFGYIGDKKSRKKAWELSILFMALSMLIIALLPGYEKIGVLAPLILIFCRLVQCFCIGGEFCGSLIIVLEQAKFKHPSWIGSIVSSAGMLGWFFGSLLSYLSTLSVFSSEDWRIPFFIGFIIGIVGYQLRKNIQDPLKEDNSKSRPIPLQEVFQKDLQSVFVVAGFAGLNGALFYTLLIFPSTYLVDFSCFSSSQASFCSMAAMFFYMIFLLWAGKIADRFGQIKTLILSIYSIFLLSFPLYWLFGTGSFSLVLSAVFFSSALVAIVMSASVGLVSNQFEAHIRYTGTAFSYNLGSALLGGPSLFVTSLLIQITGNQFAPVLYLIMCALIGLISTRFLKK